MQNANAVIERIHAAGMFGSSSDPSRIRFLLSRLGDPQSDLQYVHVAGTNGKGSVCAMLDSILQRSGYRTGLFTSPYIRRFEERIRVCGALIDESSLSRIGERVLSIAQEMEDKPTEFELVTAIGLCYFREQKVDVVVLEVGLGGRLDPTNVIEAPLLSIITGIDFDHTSLLGNTIQAIAAEKAGIIKEGCPCLFGAADGSAFRTVRAVAAMKSAPFYSVDRSEFHLREMTLSGTRFDFGERQDLYLPLLGRYQSMNVGTVLAAVDILRTRGLEISEEAIREGLSLTRWPARFELLLQDPIVIFDGGHNPEGVREAVRSVCEYFPDQKINVLSAVMRDKNFDEMIETLRPVTQKAFAVSSGMPRSVPSDVYALCFEKHRVPALAIPDLEEGIRCAIRESMETNTPLLCLGSLYLYQAVAEITEQEKAERT